METCREAKIAVLAFESGKTLVMDLEEVEAAAKKYKITVAAC